MRPQPHAVVLLGAQRFAPTLAETVAATGIDGEIAVITAGWQEREPEDDELSEHLGGRTTNLHLHRRADEVFQADPELAAAHRVRQELLRDLQDLYRIRLESALQAEQRLRERDVPSTVRAEVERAAMESIREIDQWHLAQCARARAQYVAEMRPFERKAVARHRVEIAALMGRAAAIAIAGGHVASLLNRLELFGVADFIGHRAVFAWSAGAMVVSERVVLFHDDPPQGAGAAEVLDSGLGLVPGVVVLPQPERRLHLDRSERVRLMAQRFAPATCLAFPSRSHATWLIGAHASAADQVVELLPDGRSAPFVPIPATPLPQRVRGDR